MGAFTEQLWTRIYRATIDKNNLKIDYFQSNYQNYSYLQSNYQQEQPED